MVGFKRDPHDDFATFWRKLHRRGHEQAEAFAVSPVDLYLRAKHRLAGHFARFENDNPVYQMMVCRNLAWWRQEQRLLGKTKFGGAHPQRFNAWRWESCLERAYGCVRLAREEDPRALGWNSVAQNRCQWKAGEEGISRFVSLILSGLACLALVPQRQ